MMGERLDEGGEEKIDCLREEFSSGEGVYLKKEGGFNI